MLSIKNNLLLIALSLLVGCASRPPVVYQPPQVPPLPPEIGLKREPNLTDRLTRLLMRSEKSSDSSLKLHQMEIAPSTSSTPASTVTPK